MKFLVVNVLHDSQNIRREKLIKILFMISKNILMEVRFRVLIIKTLEMILRFVPRSFVNNFIFNFIVRFLNVPLPDMSSTFL